MLAVILAILVQGNAFPYGQLAKRILNGGVGVSDFISHIRNTVGKGGDFANKNGFEYSNVYNNILQYSVLNAYLERENHHLLTTQSKNQAEFHESEVKFNIALVTGIFGILVVSLAAIPIAIIQTRRMPRRDSRRNARKNDIEDY